jgi:hypothetical protein
MKAATTMVAVLAMTAVLASPSAAQSADGATVAAGLSWLIDEGETAPGVTFDVHVPLRTSDAMTLGVVGDVSVNKLFGRWIREFAAGVRIARPLERLTPFGQFVVGVDSSFGSTDPNLRPGVRRGCDRARAREHPGPVRSPLAEVRGQERRVRPAVDRRLLLAWRLASRVRDFIAQVSGGASRLAALLLPQIHPVFSVVAPCHPGAALRNLLRSRPCQGGARLGPGQGLDGHVPIEGRVF